MPDEAPKKKAKRKAAKKKSTPAKMPKPRKNAKGRAKKTPAGQGKGKRGNVENIKPYQFKPGQSGNPSGSSKKQRAQTACRLIMDELMAEEMTNTTGDKEQAMRVILRRLRLLAMGGNLKAIDMLLERYDPPPKVHEISGPGGEPIPYEAHLESLPDAPLE